MGIRTEAREHLDAASGEVAPVTVEALTHLVVQDADPLLREMCCAHLRGAAPLGPESTSVEVHCAAGADEALETVRTLCERGERVSCALVDLLDSDGRDGIDTVEALWEFDPAMHCITLAATGPRFENEVGGRLATGCLDRWDYMLKPFSGFELVQRVRRALSSWYTHRREEARSGENLRLLLELRRTNRELERKVEDRTRALAIRNEEQEKKNRELEEALRQLETAQASLLQQEKLASIGQLAAGVAHELNNPIGYVHSNLGTLRRYAERIVRVVGSLRERCRGDETIEALAAELKLDYILEDLPDLVGESLEGTERVRSIVSDLKGFSRPSAHEAKPSDLNEGLRSTLNIVHNEIKYKAEVGTDLGDLPAVTCQIGAINQVFMNILVNAAQAIGETGTIRVATRRDGPDAVIEITDTGCGMPPETVGRIFDPFFTTKDVGKGTGLGLSISYDIVRKHGGSIDVESEVGKGTTFTIRLPIDGAGAIAAQGDDRDGS